MKVSECECFFYRCFGHLIGVQRFRLFSIDVLESNDSDEMRRILYLSQRVTHELSNRKFNWLSYRDVRLLDYTYSA